MIERRSEHCGGRVGQIGFPRAAGCSGKKSGGGGVRVELADGDGDGDFVSGDRFWIFDGL